MPRLCLGVQNLQYNIPGSEEQTTTVEVANKLENRYSIMHLYTILHKDVIQNAVSNAYKGKLESAFLGKPNSKLPNQIDAIEHSFKQMLSSQELESLGLPGIPTTAALKGIRSRLKKQKGLRRPSFIDTGAYEASFKSWIKP
jgi:hypothetical protein